MSAQILDGKLLAQKIRQRLKIDVDAFKQEHKRSPGLAVLLVGDDKASQIYVHNKEKAAQELGLYSRIVRLANDTSEEEVFAAIQELNEDSAIDAFIVQLPLPKHLHANKILQAIDPKKDADGLHPTNLGKLLCGQSAPQPCTPHGVIEILKEYNIEIAQKHAVIVGRSNIVGKPMALMLLANNATVTICHSKTANLKEEIQRADIVIAAVGVPKLIQGEWLKKGCTVIDVGMNRLENGKLVGDVEYTKASQHSAFITPVPGGVGPMTIAMLLENAVQAAREVVKNGNSKKVFEELTKEAQKLGFDY